MQRQYQKCEGSDPFLDAGLRGSIMNIAQREYWRVVGVLDLEDLVQEGYFCYYKCRRRYVDEGKTDVDAPMTVRWMQAVFQRAFMNRIYDLASKKKDGFAVSASEAVLGDESPEQLLDRCGPPEQELGTLCAKLAQAPWELLQLVKMLAGEGGAALGFKQKGRSGRETTNEYYCRLLGVSPAERNLVAELKEYFGE